VAHDGGIEQEAAELGVFEEHAVDRGRVAIGPGDDGLEIVTDQAAHDAPIEGPGRLQLVEDRGEILPQGDPEKRVAAEAEGDQQPVHAPALPRERIEPEPEQAEIDLGRLAGRRLGHADGDRRRGEVALRPGEAVQRAVGDGHALRAQSSVDLGQPQGILAQPAPDRLLVGDEGPDLRARLHRRHGPPGPATRREGAQLGLARRGAPARDAGRVGQPHVLGDGLAVHPQRPGNAPQAVAGQPPPHDLSHLDHPHLPIGHAHLLGLEAAWPGSRRAWVGECC
jgi:hypothetical protein